MTQRTDDPPRHPPRHEEPSAWERAWEAEHAARRLDARPLATALWRGVRLRCPRCGVGRVVSGFLKPNAACAHCGEGYAHIRTDDLAPWLTIILCGHLILPAMVSVERLLHPPFWVHVLVFVPIAVELAVTALPRAKGMALGLMWALRLRGDEHQY